MLIPRVALLAAFALIGIFVYWELRERKESRADARASGHSKTIRIGIRLLMPLLGGALIFQLLNILHLPLPLPSHVTHAVSLVGYLIFWGGFLLAFWARESINIHWAHAADFQVLPGQELVTDGPYQYVRHPMYLSFFLLVLGIELSVVSWLVFLAPPLALLGWWQAQKEERLLEQVFGDLYREYKKYTGMFFPVVRRRR